MICVNRLLAAAALALLLAGCDDAPSVTEAGRQPAHASESAEAREADRQGRTENWGDKLQEAIGEAAAATRDAAEEAGSAIQEEIGSVDRRGIADAIRAVGWGFERAGQIVAEAAERAAANLEGRAAPETQETARAAPEERPAQ